ncbi:MAG: sensor domain-containing diguanylate cyclase [Solirubrobacterales bacterium]|nr:sensor domain-containing diguanylate cyclase [Solirubrobacterales bacterium]
MHTEELTVERRADAIGRLQLLDRAGDPGLTSLTRLVSYVTGAPDAAINVIDDRLLRPIASVNVPMEPMPLEQTYCRLVIDSGQRIFCADAAADPRFSFSSFTRGPEPRRFYIGVPLRTSDEVVVGTLCAFDTVERSMSDEQIALIEGLAAQVVSQIELMKIVRDLGHAASHDPLTGAINRLVLGDHLAESFARQLRRGGETLVALCDVDDFKLINDLHGHAAGDEVLAAVVARLRSAVRGQDAVARVGGDEFVVFAEVADCNGALAMHRRVAQLLAEPIEIGGDLHSVTVSVGWVTAEIGEDLRELLARADAALYARKTLKPARVA